MSHETAGSQGGRNGGSVSPSGLQSDQQQPQAESTRLTRATRQRQTAAIRHGVFVRAPAGLQLRSRRVRRLMGKARRSLTWLQPSDDATLRAWCEMEILSAHLFLAVLERGEPNTVDLYRRLRGLQLQYAQQLGMTPSARAELGLVVAQGQTFTERLAHALKRTEGQR